MEFFDTIRQVRTNWEPYKKWEIEQQKKEKQTEELRKKYPHTKKELEEAEQYGRTLVDVINIMDQHSIDKSEDAMVVVNGCKAAFELLAIGLGAGLGTLFQLTPFIKKRPQYTVHCPIIGIMFASMIASIFTNIWGSKMEKEASRVARFQTRQIDLKKTRPFVRFKKYQIKEAEEIAKTLPDVAEHKTTTLSSSLNPIETILKAKKTTTELTKAYEPYLKWKKEYLKQEQLRPAKFKKLKPSLDELKKAEIEKDVMINVIKKVETYSLNYLMNIQMALCMLSAMVLGGSAAIGAGIAKLIDHLQKTKVLSKESGALNTAKIALAPVLSMTVLMVTLGPIVKLTKDAARVGRYKAKKELKNNSEEFAGFDNEKRKTVKVSEIPVPKSKGFWATLKQDIKDLKQFEIDYAEYHNYLKTEHKKELKLQEALKKVKISKQQDKDSINLQRKAFYSFEKMDEKAQRYTDDTDGAMDILKSVTTSLINATGRIICFTLLFDKLTKYNNGKFPEFSDMPKLFKHFKGSDIAKIITIWMIPPFVNILMTIKGTQVKKQAGKIGIMEAIKDLDDPRNFLDEPDKAAA